MDARLRPPDRPLDPSRLSVTEPRPLMFYLGTHVPQQAWFDVGAPLFLSRIRIERQCRRTFPRATASWALDSGGFTELDRHGGWRIAPLEYARLVARYRDEIGCLEWAAPMDWMCEPRVLAKTGLTVADHQRRTVENYLELRAIAPDLPFVPVLQGHAIGDYLRCLDLYATHGIDLAAEPLVGLGTICRRQDTAPAARIVRELAAAGLRLHGFGVKRTGLLRYGDALASADSMSWSFRARKAARAGAPSCDPARRKSCSNCLHFALEWRDALLCDMDAAHERLLWKEVPCRA